MQMFPEKYTETFSLWNCW